MNLNQRHWLNILADDLHKVEEAIFHLPYSKVEIDLDLPNLLLHVPYEDCEKLWDAGKALLKGHLEAKREKLACEIRALGVEVDS